MSDDNLMPLNPHLACRVADHMGLPYRVCRRRFCRRRGFCSRVLVKDGIPACCLNLDDKELALFLVRYEDFLKKGISPASAGSPA
ncbi:hypothetical protein EPK99_17850 [Neorhizobium lilium]|uniref:Uncharacterized protein n=1 Tax=Neorhizobium lilium TaxID=2503024 RepID=A0A444LCI0_9HYPH|nr:hypothetical protein [Neorhizobium lilium]RWX75563.1 hypothetical protein EPK99_17850 [Neorhizobium lilium]